MDKLWITIGTCLCRFTISTRIDCMNWGAKVRILAASLALFLAVLPARAENEGLVVTGSAAADIDALIGEIAAAAHAVQDREDERPAKARNSVTPYVPIDSLSPYASEKADLLETKDTAAEPEGHASDKVSLGSRSEKTSQAPQRRSRRWGDGGLRSAAPPVTTTCPGRT